MAEFITPDFLQNHSTDDIHERMLSILPADIDASEGGHVWNLTRPTALIAAELCEFILPNLIMLIFPEWSYGDFLDAHAKARSITRHDAVAATGEITITVNEDTLIPAGSIFSTASINNEPSVDYETLEDVEIPKSGTATVRIQCTQVGIVGNTIENTIIFHSGPIAGITTVTNENPVTGGADDETDEALIERIMEYDRSQNNNFVGSVSDYKRWATSVNGVGNADVIAAQDDSGLVTIILTDANGKAATEKLCEDVYNYIMSPNAPEARLAPINASISVVSPSNMDISIKATVELKEGASIESAKISFVSRLSAYLPDAMKEREVKYTRICAKLSATDGVNDFSNLQIGVKGGTYGTSNLQISASVLPEISADDIVFTTGTV